ncbi:MAG: FtsX-like permease family protein [Planctomycetia bacterium]|nr:FtsX-like permease family protein [Planctomycetia bacterium]
MHWVALKMLMGDRLKYLGIIFGVAFAALLIAQQSAIFRGVMQMTASRIADVAEPDIWVMNRTVQHIDDIQPLSENALYRVRGVSGVAWAARFYKSQARARLADGNFQQMTLLGLDDATLVGAPRQMLLGSLDDLRQPDAVVMDEAGYAHLWPDEPRALGRIFEMNDRRAVLVGICKASLSFEGFPILYARYSQAVLYAPSERKVLSFILVKGQDGVPVAEVCQRIREQTGLKALSRDEFAWTTIAYYWEKTGIPLNFGITVLLGFLVGVAIAGQTFYTFTLENLKQFGALKAMGLSNTRLVGMILLQALVVGSIGYGLGVGLAALFGELTHGSAKLAFFMPWQVLLVTAGAVLAIVMLASLLSIRRVLVLEPAIVFRG